METPRIAASSYSNTAPLIWSFLYGSNHGKVELILDNAPARSAELLANGRVDAALVPVAAYPTIGDVRLVPDVCVGALDSVKSVLLVTKGDDLENVRSVALDTSSRTSVVLTKLIFREFLGREPEWREAEPNVRAMLETADCALIIGDPALAVSEPPAPAGGQNIRTFDLAEAWVRYTGLGFVFAMWMSRHERINIDFGAARREGLENLDAIASNFAPQLGLTNQEMLAYLSERVRYAVDERMHAGMELYFNLAQKHGLLPKRDLIFAE